MLSQRLAEHPDLLRMSLQVEQQGVVIEAERAKAIPNVEIGAGYRQFVADDQHAFVFSASIPLPIFDRNSSAIEEAAHRRSKARAEEQAVSVQLVAELHAAYLRLSNAHQQAVELQSDNLPSAKGLFADVEAGYRAGKFGYLDLLEAQRTMSALQ